MNVRAEPPRERHWAYYILLSALVNAALLGAAVPALRWPRHSAVRIETPPPTRATSAMPAELVVYISGAVSRPGVYHLKAGAILQDAVQAAGGLVQDADAERVNLAQRLADGQHVHVPRLGEPTTQPASAMADEEASGTTAPATAGALVNINTATVDELDTLPGIGPQLAGRIVAYRQAHGPFSTVDELQNVDGVGEKTVERLRSLVTVQ